jgi:hypothetical protein
LFINTLKIGIGYCEVCLLPNNDHKKLIKIFNSILDVKRKILVLISNYKIIYKFSRFYEFGRSSKFKHLYKY